MLDNLIRLSTHASYRFMIAVNYIPMAAFTDCTLPTIEWDMLPVKEGGLNTYVHQLPGQRKPATVSLKYGVSVANMLFEWYIAAMHEEFYLARRDVTITFFSRPFLPTIAYNIEDCYPSKWVGPSLKSSDNTIAVQTLDLVCGEIEVVPMYGALIPN